MKSLIKQLSVALLFLPLSCDPLSGGYSIYSDFHLQNNFGQDLIVTYNSIYYYEEYNIKDTTNKVQLIRNGEKESIKIARSFCEKKEFRHYDKIEYSFNLLSLKSAVCVTVCDLNENTLAKWESEENADFFQRENWDLYEYPTTKKDAAQFEWTYTITPEMLNL